MTQAWEFHTNAKGQAKRELVNNRRTMETTRNDIRRQVIHHIVDFVSLLETASFHTVPTLYFGVHTAP